MGAFLPPERARADRLAAEVSALIPAYIRSRTGTSQLLQSTDSLDRIATGLERVGPVRDARLDTSVALIVASTGDRIPGGLAGTRTLSIASSGLLL